MLHMEPVFADTLRRAEVLPPSGSHKHQRAPPIEALHAFRTQLEVQNTDCLEAYVSLRQQCPTRRIGLLNMANAEVPGGGVLHGAQGQEEDICRRTTLYFSLHDSYYPLRDDEIIYSEDVFVLKDRKYQPLQQPAKVDAVLTSAALCRPATLQGKYRYPADRHTMRLKVCVLLQTALWHHLQCLVLGAWGCGAFENPPYEVARLFRELLDPESGEFGASFDRVVFAIWEEGDRAFLNHAFTDVLLHGDGPKSEVAPPPAPQRSCCIIA